MSAKILAEKRSVFGGKYWHRLGRADHAYTKRMSKNKGWEEGVVEVQAGRKARMRDHIKTKLKEEPITHTQERRVNTKKGEVGTQRNAGVGKNLCVRLAKEATEM